MEGSLGGYSLNLQRSPDRKQLDAAGLRLLLEGKAIRFIPEGRLAISGDGEEACVEVIQLGGEGVEVHGLAIVSLREEAECDSTTDLIGRDSSGRLADVDCFLPSMSRDGRFVAFVSSASNLVEGDTNACEDVFVRDRDPDNDGVMEPNVGVTTRVSVSSSGAQGNAYSGARFGPLGPSISSEGTRVVFVSGASTLHANDEDTMSDVFLHDRSSRTTLLVSVAAGELRSADGPCSAAVISGNGRFIAYSSSARNLGFANPEGIFQIYLFDLDSGQTSLLSVARSGEVGDGASTEPSISNDGRFIAFRSSASNLEERSRANPSSRHTKIVLCDRDPDGDGVFAIEGQRLLNLSCADDCRGGCNAAFPDLAGSSRTCAFQTANQAVRLGQGGVVVADY